MEQNSDDDKITKAFLSGSAYERLRLQRQTYFSQSVTTKLTWQSILLGVIAMFLPLYALYPATVIKYLPAAHPAVASPKIVLLGLLGVLIELFAAALLVGTALYRIRFHPLTEAQARTVLNVEDFASYVGFGTGGIAISITTVYFLLGIIGNGAVKGYIESMGGVNPFAASGVGLSVAELAVGAFIGAIWLMSLRLYLQYRLLALDAE